MWLLDSKAIRAAKRITRQHFKGYRARGGVKSLAQYRDELAVKNGYSGWRGFCLKQTIRDRARGDNIGPFRWARFSAGENPFPFQRASRTNGAINLGLHGLTGQHVWLSEYALGCHVLIKDSGRGELAARDTLLNYVSKSDINVIVATPSLDDANGVMQQIRQQRGDCEIRVFAERTSMYGKLDAGKPLRIDFWRTFTPSMIADLMRRWLIAGRCAPGIPGISLIAERVLLTSLPDWIAIRCALAEYHRESVSVARQYFAEFLSADGLREKLQMCRESRLVSPALRTNIYQLLQSLTWMLADDGEISRYFALVRAEFDKIDSQPYLSDPDSVVDWLNPPNIMIVRDEDNEQRTLFDDVSNLLLLRIIHARLNDSSPVPYADCGTEQRKLHVFLNDPRMHLHGGQCAMSRAAGIRLVHCYRSIEIPQEVAQNCATIISMSKGEQQRRERLEVSERANWIADGGTVPKSLCNENYVRLTYRIFDEDVSVLERGSLEELTELPV